MEQLGRPGTRGTPSQSPQEVASTSLPYRRLAGPYRGPLFRPLVFPGTPFTCKVHYSPTRVPDARGDAGVDMYTIPPGPVSWYVPPSQKPYDPALPLCPTESDDDSQMMLVQGK